MKICQLATTDMVRQPLLRTMAMAAPRLFTLAHFGKSKKHFPSLHLSQILTHNSIHHHLQQQKQKQNQQWERTFTTSSTFSSSNSNGGKNQDAIPLSALNTEQIDVEHNDSFLLQKILISESSFDSIRNRKGVYIDKTKSIYQAILEPDQKYNFFVRPRRFGKSLLCSTLSNLFQGKSRILVMLAMYRLKLRLAISFKK